MIALPIPALEKSSGAAGLSMRQARKHAARRASNVLYTEAGSVIDVARPAVTPHLGARSSQALVTRVRASRARLDPRSQLRGCSDRWAGSVRYRTLTIEVSNERECLLRVEAKRGPRLQRPGRGKEGREGVCNSLRPYVRQRTESPLLLGHHCCGSESTIRLRHAKARQSCSTRSSYSSAS
jgi:hypothetical protein